MESFWRRSNLSRLIECWLACCLRHTFRSGHCSYLGSTRHSMRLGHAKCIHSRLAESALEESRKEHGLNQTCVLMKSLSSSSTFLATGLALPRLKTHVEGSAACRFNACEFAIQFWNHFLETEKSSLKYDLSVHKFLICKLVQH